MIQMNLLIYVSELRLLEMQMQISLYPCILMHLEILELAAQRFTPFQTEGRIMKHQDYLQTVKMEGFH